MFEDFLKRMTKGFGATMFLITLPVVMLVVGLLCYTILDMFGFGNYALRLSCGFAVIGGGQAIKNTGICIKAGAGIFLFASIQKFCRFN